MGQLETSEVNVAYFRVTVSKSGGCDKTYISPGQISIKNRGVDHSYHFILGNISSHICFTSSSFSVNYFHQCNRFPLSALMCVLLYPVYLGVCHLSSAARNCVLRVLPAIPAVVRSCHGRVCTIRFLLGMQQLVQLLPAFESRQKIDLLNSISLISLLGSPNNLKS